MTTSFNHVPIKAK